VSYPDFEEFIGSLNAHRVRYLVVGGYARGFHARPRATKDLAPALPSWLVSAARYFREIVRTLVL
jgi:hypothetical protein